MNKDIVYYIWGAGIVGARAYYYLNRWINIGGFIDGNVDKQQSGYMGEIVISLNDFLDIRKENYNAKVIIAVLLDNENMQDELKENGIWDYYMYTDCPIEWFNPNTNHLYEEHVIKKIHSNDKYVIFGKSIYSVVVNEWVKHITGQYANMYSDLEQCEKDDGKILITARVNKNLILESMVDMYDCTSEIKEYYNSKLEVFKNCNRGKRCFIIGLGPSLRIEDLNKLANHNEICISMNSIDKIFGDTLWRPTYYLATDPRVDDEVNIEEIDVKYKIIADVSKKLVMKQKEGSIFINHVKYDFLEDAEPEFTDDFAQFCSTGCTVTYACIQFAVYMGIKEIYLLGVDFSGYGNQGGKYKHFYKEEKLTASCFYKQNLLAYESAKKYADEHGIKIYNATRGGKLEVFERVDFDTLFDKKKGK